METQASQAQDAGSPKAHEAILISASAPRPAQKTSRKRTKTGCLSQSPMTLWALVATTDRKTACRERRIKCSGEQPMCANCILSKRNCEGYNHRVIFKRPSVGHALVAPSSTSTWNPSFQHPHT